MWAITAGAEHAGWKTTPQPRLVEAAHEFEAQLMKELLRPMTAGDDEESGSDGALQDFAGQALGQALSKRGGFGIATSILHRLSQNDNEPHTDPAGGKNFAVSTGGLK